MSGDLERVLQELGVHHIPVRQSSSRYVYMDRASNNFRPVFSSVVLVGSFFHPVSVADLRECLDAARIPFVYQDGQAVTARFEHSRLGDMPVGNEVILTVDPRYYQAVTRRSEESVLV
ncbi:MAG: hypothetical protein Q7R56_01215 [Nanoarchaeota archaeon]|nr:hypothetical protein [Nanoarchaeota archaeon]